MEVLAAELQHSHHLAVAVEDACHIVDARRVGIELITFHAGVGDVHHAVPGGMKGLNGFNDQVFIRLALVTPQGVAGGTLRFAGKVGVGDGRH
jgi:hypothetical protein